MLFRSVDPVRWIDAIDQWEINQSFGSPALWTKVGMYCQQTGRRMETLRTVLSAGAPVSPRVLEQVRAAMHAEGNVFTPYGATEALPIASIESRQVLKETAQFTRQGRGTCVGARFDSVLWKVIEITDGPIEAIEDVREVPRGSVGELMVCSPSVSKAYVTRTDQNALHKVIDRGTQIPIGSEDNETRIWHRMGDVGYLDDQDRFWYCGRKSHRIITSKGDLYTEPIEAVVNTHSSVYRSALVPLGKAPNQRPVIIIEPWPKERRGVAKSLPKMESEWRNLLRRYHPDLDVERFIVYPKRLPTDIRHNSKIFREQLTAWLRNRLSD